jgi:hypothetical protein
MAGTLRGNTYTYDGVNYNVNVSGTGANWNLTAPEKQKLIQAIIDKGRPLTDLELIDLKLINEAGNVPSSARFENVKNAMSQIITLNAPTLGFTPQGAPVNLDGTAMQTSAQAMPFEPNQYYRDLYSLQPGTGGRALFEELAGTFERQSGLAETAATVGFQQQALQQAQVVKQITDQVRAERMARLRAGMSESQIANQDMQQMMTNVNTLNQNAALLNQARLEAQVGQAGARDEAYLEYLKQINERGQVGAAMAASDAGSASQQALEYMRRTGQPYDVALGAVTNSPVPPKNNN